MSLIVPEDPVGCMRIMEPHLLQLSFNIPKDRVETWRLELHPKPF
ncbi:hypothetical protein [Leptospira mayottensis]|nr:hypothetical protein [Leptospira mayottensis]